MSEPAPTVEVYQLHVYLREIGPAIWRRILVRSDSTIADLHATLQIAMGWTDSHLNQFIIRGKPYGVAHIGGVGFTDDSRQIHLADLHFRLRERFLYEYDFGDGWQHQIRLEKRWPLHPTRTYPICIGGQRAAPPEDCGGPWAFMELRQTYSVGRMGRRLTDIVEEIRAGGDIEDYREELLVLQSWLTVDRFSRWATNRRLRLYAAGDKERMK